jgi:plastocyanin
MSKNVAIGIAVVLALLALGWYFTQPKQTVPPIPVETTSIAPIETPSAVASSEAMMAKNMVSISSAGYEPKDITVKVGDSVTFENKDSANHTVSSDPHPTHTLYPVVNLGLIKPGEKKSATFDKIGKFIFHDHLNPSMTGSVIVQ